MKIIAIARALSGVVAIEGLRVNDDSSGHLRISYHRDFDYRDGLLTVTGI